MDALNSALEAGLKAAKISLEVMTTANSEAEAAAEHNALQAGLNALHAEGNACWANSEGMRAEEEISRRFLADVAAAKKVRNAHTLGAADANHYAEGSLESSCSRCTVSSDSIDGFSATLGGTGCFLHYRS